MLSERYEGVFNHLVQSTDQELTQDLVIRYLNPVAYAIRRCWIGCNRTRWRFMNMYVDWLEEMVCQSQPMCQATGVSTLVAWSGSTQAPIFYAEGVQCET